MSPKAARGDATPFLPERRNLKALREAAAHCRGCHLYKGATQTVFSNGPKGARIMMVGEIPGDREYLTNVVKHFKFEERGKRRIHQKPGKREVDACMPWLRAELGVVRPTALLLLGATAAQALLGDSFRLTRQRGRPIESGLAELVVATIHPSAILRAGDGDARQAQREAFTADLRVIAEHTG